LSIIFCWIFNFKATVKRYGLDLSFSGEIASTSGKDLEMDGDELTARIKNISEKAL
jgi:hypothetical protein